MFYQDLAREGTKMVPIQSKVQKSTAREWTSFTEIWRGAIDSWKYGPWHSPYGSSSPLFWNEIKNQRAYGLSWVLESMGFFSFFREANSTIWLMSSRLLFPFWGPGFKDDGLHWLEYRCGQHGSREELVEIVYCICYLSSTYVLYLIYF